MLANVFTTDGYENYLKLSYADIDPIVKQLQATSDTEERQRLTIEAQKKIYATNNFVFLLHVNTYKVVSKGVENVASGRGNSFYLWMVTK